jgi:hypothetical protein
VLPHYLAQPPGHGVGFSGELALLRRRQLHCGLLAGCLGLGLWLELGSGSGSEPWSGSGWGRGLGLG